MATYQPIVQIDGQLNQLDDPDGLNIAHLTSVDYVQFDTTYADGSAEGRLQWNADDGTLEVGMPGGNVNLQIGQELLVRAHNVSGATINNGTPVYVSGSQANRPTIAPASANSYATAFAFGVATENIANNSNGYITTLGLVRDVDTSNFSDGDRLFLGETGGYVSTSPTWPNLEIHLARVISSHATEGIIEVNIIINPLLVGCHDVSMSAPADGQVLTYNASNLHWENNNSEDIANAKDPFFNGTFRETFDALISANATHITLALEQSGGGDLTMQFSDGSSTLDCTPAATLNIAPGTDVSPIGTYVYVLQSTKTLASSTAEWPSDEHIKVCYLLVPSVQFVLDHGGGYINQNWNDHLAGTNLQGHLSHVTQKVRSFGANWFSGVSANGTTSYFDITAGDVRWKSNEGVIAQMHHQTFPAQDTNNTITLVKNNFISPYNHIQNLFDITDDSTGNTISNNRYFNLVFWGVQNKTNQGSGVFINLPSGFYTLESSALIDSDGYDDYTFPREFNVDSGTAFLIARVTFKMGSTWTHIQTTDLRGKSPNTSAGGASINDHGSLGGLADDDHTQYSLVDGTRAFTGNVTLPSLNMSGHIIAYGGSTPSNQDLLRWSTANGRFEADALIITPGSHSLLQDLDADDHTQYVLVDGTREMTGCLTANHGVVLTTNITTGAVKATQLGTGTAIHGIKDPENSSSDCALFAAGHTTTSNGGYWSYGMSVFSSDTVSSGLTNTGELGAARFYARLGPSSAGNTNYISCFTASAGINTTGVAATVLQVIGLFVTVENASSGSSVTTGTAARLYMPSAAGTISHKWGVYSTGDAKNRFDGSIAPGVFSDSTRPAASSVPVGSMIYNTTDAAPNFSDGTNWRTAAGAVT